MDEMNDLLLRQDGLKRICFDGQIGGGFEGRFHGGRDGFVGDIDESVGGENLDGGGVEIERRIERLAFYPIILAVVDCQLGIHRIDCE